VTPAIGSAGEFWVVAGADPRFGWITLLVDRTAGVHNGLETPAALGERTFPDVHAVEHAPKRRNLFSVREIATDARSVYEGAFSGRLSRADTVDIVDVRSDPLEDGRHPSDTISGTAELSLGKTHELVGRAEAARQQERHDVVRLIGPQMLTPGRWKKLPQPVFDRCLVSDRCLAGQAGSEAAVTLKRLVSDQIGVGLDRERLG